MLHPVSPSFLDKLIPGHTFGVIRLQFPTISKPERRRCSTQSGASLLHNCATCATKVGSFRAARLVRKGIPSIPKSQISKISHKTSQWFSYQINSNQSISGIICSSYVHHMFIISCRLALCWVQVPRPSIQCLSRSAVSLETGVKTAVSLKYGWSMVEVWFILDYIGWFLSILWILWSIMIYFDLHVDVWWV